MISGLPNSWRLLSNSTMKLNHRLLSLLLPIYKSIKKSFLKKGIEWSYGYQMIQCISLKS